MGFGIDGGCGCGGFGDPALIIFLILILLVFGTGFFPGCGVYGEKK